MQYLMQVDVQRLVRCAMPGRLCFTLDLLMSPMPLWQNLESEQLDNQLLEPAPVPTARPAQAARPETATAMPSVPQGRPAQAAKPAKTQEELELEALEQEMAV